jgi:hypothetical protein
MINRYSEIDYQWDCPQGRVIMARTLAYHIFQEAVSCVTACHTRCPGPISLPIL